LRPGAFLSVVVVNGDAEDDGASEQGNGLYLTSLAQVTALVQSLETDPTMASVSYVDQAPPEVSGRQIDQLVEATGGVEVDTETAGANVATSLAEHFTEGVGAFHLSSTPAAPSRLDVEVNGVEAPLWSYDPALNDVVFPAGSLPAPGSMVTVTYGVGCP